MAREFHNSQESTEFALKHYGNFVNGLSEDERSGIGMIQARARRLGVPDDARCIQEIKKCMKHCPPVPEDLPYDIIAYRSGEMCFSDRPYISATFLLAAALKYSKDKDYKDVHRIIIRRGSKIFPLRALGKDYGDGEAEIIIITDKLKEEKGYYSYSN